LRTLVLGSSLLLIGLLAFLTVSVAIRDGVTVLVVVSGVILAVLGLGVIGAMSSIDDE
jgi:hypothetical protein